MSPHDYAHTRDAAENREKKATALAATAARLGLQPYELKLVGGTVADADRRTAVRKETGLDRNPSVETWGRAIGLLDAHLRELPGTTTCDRDGCGSAVRVVITESGNRITVDPLPHPAGRVWPRSTKDGQRAVIIAGHQTPPEDEPLYRLHDRSCPATAHKRPSEAPRCTACAQPLDGVLAARLPSYTTHPTCSDEEVRPDG